MAAVNPDVIRGAGEAWDAIVEKYDGGRGEAEAVAEAARYLGSKLGEKAENFGKRLAAERWLHMLWLKKQLET
ncbi:MAG TPA: hypothetical protein VKA30_02660 [Actinomycetota bacterium]|nr:hypothetical protein [Actinomycetota bacterium]